MTRDETNVMTNAHDIDRVLALRVINLLRNGANCLEASELFSGGRSTVFQAADDLFDEIEITDAAAVRWIKGNTGTGKTHSFARLIEIARRRRWVYCYVQVSGKGMGVEIHRFEQILAAVFRNMTPPTATVSSDGKSDGWT